MLDRLQKLTTQLLIEDYLHLLQNNPTYAYNKHTFPLIKHPEGSMHLSVRYLIAPNFRLSHLESVLSEQFDWSPDDLNYPCSKPVDVPVVFPRDNDTRNFQMGNPYQQLKWGNPIVDSDSDSEKQKSDTPGSERTEIPHVETNQYDDPLTSVLTSWMGREGRDRERGEHIVDSRGKHRKFSGVSC